MSRPFYILFLLMAMFSVPVMAAQSPAKTREKKRVLVLYSLDKGHPGHVLTDQGIDVRGSVEMQ